MLSKHRSNHFKMTAAYTINAQQQVGEGTYYRVAHESTSTKCSMTFGLYVPKRFSAAIDGSSGKDSVPVLFWLSGLTCDDTNFAMKAGPSAFAAAEDAGIAICMPDTSPRDGVPNVDSYDLGIGASFYVNATEDPYDTNYQMYTYITEELPTLLETNFSIGKDGLRSIAGHSMVGYLRFLSIFSCSLQCVDFFDFLFRWDAAGGTRCTVHRVEGSVQLGQCECI